VRALLDLNVLLDVFLNRAEFLADSAAVFQANHEGRMDACISAASLGTVFYVVRRNADYDRAKKVVSECLDSFTVIPVSRSTLELAITLAGRDFEDNLQIASAVEGGVDGIVTRDPRGYVDSIIPVQSPAEVLAQIGNQS
jgi:predicted nucleic acid-binding protein